jgi:hypothetical protein
MFDKARCRLCHDKVRFELRHLRDKLPESLKDPDIAILNMSKTLKRYFEGQP